jgi:hypothetical protein
VQDVLEELVVVSPGRVHDRHAKRHAPTRIEIVGYRHIKHVEVVHHLGLLSFALRLFGGADEVSELMLIAVAGRNRPVVCREWAPVLGAGMFFRLGICASAQRANHGRARSRGNSTLTCGTNRNQNDESRYREANPKPNPDNHPTLRKCCDGSFNSAPESIVFLNYDHSGKALCFTKTRTQYQLPYQRTLPIVDNLK